MHAYVFYKLKLIFNNVNEHFKIQYNKKRISVEIKIRGKYDNFKIEPNFKVPISCVRGDFSLKISIL